MKYAHSAERPAAALVLLFMGVFLLGCQGAAEGSPRSGGTTATLTPPIRQAATTPSAPATQVEDTPQPAVGTQENLATLAPSATTTSGRTTMVAPSAAMTPSQSPKAPGPTAAGTPATKARLEVQEYEVPRGSHPHDVAPAAGGGVWYTAQAAGKLGRLDPATGKIEEIPLGSGSLPHGVIVGPDGAAWVTDGGLNAIVRVDPQTRDVKRYDLPPEHRGANLNTATFDAAGKLWFTGQGGVYGVLDTGTGEMQVYEAPRGRGPYGITAAADGKVYYASLAGSYLGQVDPQRGEATVLEPPTARQGARRAWVDSKGAVWVSEWNAGQLARFDPGTSAWAEWRLPGQRPMAYAVYVDWQDKVWLSDFGSNSLVRFDPETEQFESVPLPSPSASVRQIHGRPGEIWGAESGADKLVVVRVR